jgi:hypothetical protein
MSPEVAMFSLSIWSPPENPHTHLVTSDLAFQSKSGHHSQSGARRLKWRAEARKSFAVKILLSKSFAIKTLTHLFCETRAGQGFQGVLGEGDVLRDTTFRLKLRLHGSLRIASQEELFLRQIHRMTRRRHA